jgi:CXXC-20-CXXC protein
MPRHACPHCRKTLPTRLVWKTLVAGQVAHKCPSCRKRFRLTYAAKRRVAYLNVTLVLGFSVLVGYAFYWNLPALVNYALAYLGLAALIVIVIPFQARYEKTSAPNH